MATETADFTQALHDRSFDALWRWVLIAGATAVGTVLLWDYGYIDYVIRNDLTFVSQTIMGLLVAASAYIVWHIYDLCIELRTVGTIMARLQSGPAALPGLVHTDTGRLPRVAVFVSDVIRTRRASPGADTDLLLQSVNAELRVPARFGIYAADALYKLGMIGTVVGFLLMLASMEGITSFDPETLRGALQRMTAGMAISLLTTIAGIAGGMLVRIQTNILENLALRISAALVRINTVLVPSAFSVRDAGHV
jgi:hypothetical protein